MVRYYGTIFNRTGTVRNKFLGTVRNYGSIFFPGSNYEKYIVLYRTASLGQWALQFLPWKTFSS